VPSLTALSWSDHRALGVAITEIVLENAGIATRFAYDAPQLREGGCYPAEDGFSWTDGELGLPARFFAGLDGPLMLTVHTKRHDLRYPLHPTAVVA